MNHLSGVVLICCLAASAGAQDLFDLQGHIDRAVAAGQKTITVPPGRHRVAPHDRQHLVLRGLKDTTIVADGAELVCTETTRALTIADCTNLTLRGLTIDYDPLPFTQGRLTALSADKKVHDIELFDGYPAAAAARNFKYEIYTPDTRLLRCGDHYPASVTPTGERGLRVTMNQGAAADPEQVGDIIVIGAEFAPHGSIPHAVECSASTNVRLERVTLYASNCFGFLEYNCDGSVYDRCVIDRRAPGDDPVKRADPRARSLDADAFHSKHALRGPSYLGCVARYMGDDGINICGDYHLVGSAAGTELRVLAKQRLNIAVGDPVELLTYEGRRLPNATVTAVTRLDTITDEERAWLVKQRMDEGLRSRECREAWQITLDRAADLPRGSLIASARRMGNGFRVIGCEFGFNRSRGILIKASDGVVANNRLVGNWGPAILCSPEFWWLESGSSNNVAIRGNQITDCRSRAIVVEATGGAGLFTGTPAAAGAHNNITVEGNQVSGGPQPSVVLTSILGLRLTGNRFVGLPAGTEPIKLTNCEQVNQSDNQ
ncbi:MAG: right-handed parallel beta-helix repeat-containing protein [Armatimonadetes bacterium]|nr:right-handed parallel beta-helix repeat-containing protein [Armatimonadota bacterium]